MVRAAAARHLRDVVDGPARGLVWDREAAERVFRFFAGVLTIPDGDRAGQGFALEPWQKFVVGSAFGWKRATTGRRRFKTVYVETGKGSGKSPMGAGAGLYMLTADGEHGAECYAAAVTRDQAKIAFRDAVAMVQASPALSARLQTSGDRDVYNLAHRESGSYFRPISSEGKGLDGKRVHFALLDEVHEHPTSVVVDKMVAGLKGRSQPMIWEITNSGVDRTSVCWAHHEYSRQVVNGELDDDEWFAFVCDLDPDDDPMVDRSCWPKANPSLGVTIREDYLEKQVREARGMPAKESIVRRLNFCQWVDAANPWIAGDLWRACEVDAEAFDLARFDGARCYGGLDLSGKNDLCSFALVWKVEDGYAAATWSWCPEIGVEDRARRDRVPYGTWIDQGHLIAVPGRAVDYGFVARDLGDLAARFDIAEIAFDPYRIAYLEQDLDDQGVGLNLTPHGQGFYRSAESQLWMPRSVELLEGAVGKGQLRVLKSPVLTWAAASAVTETDPKENRIFAKRRSRGRIDPIVALAMAFGAAEREFSDESVYERRELLVL